MVKSSSHKEGDAGQGDDRALCHALVLCSPPHLGHPTPPPPQKESRRHLSLPSWLILSVCKKHILPPPNTSRADTCCWEIKSQIAILLLRMDTGCEDTSFDSGGHTLTRRLLPLSHSPHRLPAWSLGCEREVLWVSIRSGAWAFGHAGHLSPSLQTRGVLAWSQEPGCWLASAFRALTEGLGLLEPEARKGWEVRERVHKW